MATVTVRSATTGEAAALTNPATMLGVAKEPSEEAGKETDPEIGPLTVEGPQDLKGIPVPGSPRDKEGVSDGMDDSEGPQYPQRWKILAILAALCLAIFLVALDQTIVSTAIPRITDEFHSLDDVGWYGASYLLTRAALNPTYGRIYSHFDLKYTFLVTIAVFELGSLVCATAQSSKALIVGRAVAGAGVAGLFTGSILIVVHCAPLRRRPLMMGVIGSMWTIASVSGPLLGGVFTDELSWRWCFYINLPIGAFTIAVVAILIQPKKPDGSDKLTVWEKIMKLDLLGALLTISATVCFILALQWGGSTYPWNDSTIIGLLVAAGCLSVILAYFQIKLGDKGTFPPKLMRNRNIVCACLFSTFFAAGYYSLVYYLAIYYQSVRGYSALHAGLRMLPLTISTSISGSATGALITAVGYYNPFMLLCMALFASGAGSLTTLTVTTPYWRSLGFQILTGSGIGIGFQAGVIVAQTGVPPASIPVAISVIGFALTIGGTLFVPISQAVFQYGLLQWLKIRAPQVNGHILLQSGATNLHALLDPMNQQNIIEPVLQAYAEGTRDVFWVVMACAAAAFVATCGLRWKSVKSRE